MEADRQVSPEKQGRGSFCHAPGLWETAAWGGLRGHE